MTAILLRRKRLGRGSCNGVANVSTTNIKVVRNWMPDDWPTMGSTDRLCVFRWGCTSNLPLNLGDMVVNTAKAIHWCSDKRQSRLDMQQAGVPVPETWSTEEWCNQRQTYEGQNHHELFVARPATHAQGRQLVSGSYEEIYSRVFAGGYVSRLINKVAEYRVMVVQNRVAWVAKKTPGNPEDVAWNVAQGGRFDNVRWGEWPIRVVQAALAAAKVGELDFGGVDVMVTADGSPYVLEVNSAPSQTSPYRQQCLAKCFDHIVANGKRHFPDYESGEAVNWKHLIHPAVRS